jgi:hypothetical protein
MVRIVKLTTNTLKRRGISTTDDRIFMGHKEYGAVALPRRSKRTSKILVRLRANTAAEDRRTPRRCAQTGRPASAPASWSAPGLWPLWPSARPGNKIHQPSGRLAQLFQAFCNRERRTGDSKVTCQYSGGGPPHSKTLRADRASGECASVVECARPLAALAQRTAWQPRFETEQCRRSGALEFVNDSPLPFPRNAIETTGLPVERTGCPWVEQS